MKGNVNLLSEKYQDGDLICGVTAEGPVSVDGLLRVYEHSANFSSVLIRFKDTWKLENEAFYRPKF